MHLYTHTKLYLKMKINDNNTNNNIERISLLVCMYVIILY